MKIAICISGAASMLEDTIQSIKSFYQGPHDFYFFGYLWVDSIDDQSITSKADKELDVCLLSASLTNQLTFTELIIENRKSDPDFSKYREHDFHDIGIHDKQTCLNTEIPITWHSDFYSLMRSNHLKLDYEIQNNMCFDVVVRSHVDTRYPDTTICQYLPDSIQIHTLYCDTTCLRKEYMIPSINNIFYFGSSNTMDLIDSFYWVYYNGNFFKLLECNYFDGGYKTLSPGALLYKWATIKNILPNCINFIQSSLIK